MAYHAPHSNADGHHTAELDGYPPFPTVADAWSLARHDATKQERILYALANVAEHPDSDLIYDWRRQYSADAEPDLTDPARALAYLLEHTLNHSPDTDAQPFIILLHHRLGASASAPAWDEPPQYLHRRRPCTALILTTPSTWATAIPPP